MSAGIDSGTLDYYTSITRGGGSVSSILGGQGATSLVQTSINNISQINAERQARRDQAEGRSTFDASQALFGDLTSSLLNTLSASSQASINLALQRTDSSANSSERAELTQRLSQLSIERLAILENAASETPDPEVAVDQQLQRSIDAFSQDELVTFRLAVRDAIDIVTARAAPSVNTSA